MKINFLGIFTEIASAVVLVAIDLMLKTLRHNRQKR